jgi:DNA-binding GntR family transcriptional regulator
MATTARSSNRRPTIRRAGPQSLTDQVYQSLKEDILRTRRAPGDLLLEPELAEHYRVSKTPIREALRWLVQEDWVLTLPRKGYLVRPLRLEDIREVFALRQLLEPGLVNEATGRASPVDLDRLRTHVDIQSRAREHLDDALLSATGFHLTLAEMAGNVRAVRILSGLLDEVRRLHYMIPTLESHITSEAELDSHRAIIAALVANRPDEAAQLMSDHLTEAGQAMVGVFGGFPTARR